MIHVILIQNKFEVKVITAPLTLRSECADYIEKRRFLGRRDSRLPCFDSQESPVGATSRTKVERQKLVIAYARGAGQ